MTRARDDVLTLGRYTLCGEIASGGMAAIYFARMEGTGGFTKSVAVKRLHPHFATDPDFRSMILDEARLAARIRHPNVVSPIDVLDLDDEVLLAMEYVHGQAVSRLVREATALGENLPVAVCASIMSGMLHGLHAAHEATDDRGRPLGIVHRDISPHNVIVGVDGITRVIDFGIAKAKTSSEATQAGIVKGKIPYLAPEQLDGELATVTTDVYAAALVFWEILVGRRLFEAEYDHAIVAMILRGHVEPPSAFVPGVPPELDAIILRGIARDPGERFASARDMALAIEGVVQLANPSTVGALVERLAHEDLAKRARKLSRLERLPNIPIGELSLSLSGSSSVKRPLPAAPLRPAPSLPRAPRPRPPAPPPQPPGLEPPIPLTSNDIEVLPPPPGVLKRPAIQMAEVAWMPNLPSGAINVVTEKPRRVGGGIFMLAFLALAVAVFVYLLPTIVKRGYQKSAARRGITLAMRDAVVSPKELRLLGVSASIQEVPGFAFRAESVTIALRSLEPARVTVNQPEITLDGAYPEVDRSFDAWLLGQGAPGADDRGSSLTQVELVDGKVNWVNAFGPGTRASLENVTGHFTREAERPLGEDYVLRAGIVKLGTEKSLLGPHELTVRRDGVERTFTLKLDPQGSTGAQVSYATHGDGRRDLALRVPRRSLAELHLPEALFGGLATSSTRVELTGDLAFLPRPKPHGEGKILVAATALKVGPGSSPMDALLDLTLAAEGDAPLAATQASSLTLGVVKTKVSGSIDGSGKGFLVDLSSRRCDLPSENPQGTSRLYAPSAELSQAFVFLAPCPTKIR